MNPSNEKLEDLDQELRATGWPTRWERFRLPVELEGRTFLDVGCWEGVHCAEAVRRGAAEVVGVDLCTSPELLDNVERYGFDFAQMDVFGEEAEEQPDQEVGGLGWVGTALAKALR